MTDIDANEFIEAMNDPKVQRFLEEARDYGKSTFTCVCSGSECRCGRRGEIPTEMEVMGIKYKREMGVWSQDFGPQLGGSDEG